MNNSLTLGKKALVLLTTVAMVVWTLGVAAFALPTSASAASPGSLVKSASLSAVYYYGYDGQRYTFPNLKTYETWYSDFSGVQTISDSELAAIPLAGNVVYRPGSRFVKIQSDPKLYAVTPNGALRWIETEAVAEGLAGSAWNTLADDIPEVFFVDYTVGASLMSAEAYEGMLVMDGSDKYVIWGGEKRMLTSAGQSANNFQDRFFVAPGDDLLGSLSAGSDVSGADGDLNDPAQMGGSGSGTTPAGGLNISLASDTPAGNAVPDGASQVDFMHFNLTANGGDATVDTLKLKMAGLGATGNIGSVYLFEGNTRLTNARSVNSTTRMATFASLGLMVKSGQTRTLRVVVDMAAAQDNGGDTLQFQIESASAVTTDATVSGSFPVTSNAMTKSATDVGGVTIADTGSLSNPSIGEIAKIANFRLTANSTEGFSLHRLRVEVDRAADHGMYELRQNNTTLASGTVSGSYVDFELTTPFEIAQGNNREFEVWAKVGGENSDLINVRVEETTDLYAVGLKFGHGVAVTNNFGAALGSTCTGDGTNYDCTTVQAGKLTVAFNGPTTGDISENRTGVVIWEGTLTAENLVEIRDWEFDIDGGSGTADLCTSTCGTASTTHNYQNFRLVRADSGSTVSGPYDMSSVSDTAATISMTDDFTIPAGESWDVQLLTDVQDDASFTDISAGDTIRATWDADQTTARDGNNDSMTVGTDIIPGSDLAGNTLTIRTASLTVSVASNPASSTYVKGTQNVDMVGFAFAAGTSSDVTVSSVTFKMYGDDDAEHSSDDDKDVNVVNSVNSCSIYDSQTGGRIDGPESPGTFTSGTGSDITFSGFTWKVPAAQTYRMVVRCNLANVTPTSSTNDSVTLEIDAAGDVTAVDGEGNSVSGSTANTTQTIFQTVASAGSLTIALDGDSPSSTIILSNSTGVTTSKFKLTASNEAFTVDRFSLVNTSGSDVAVSSVELHYQDEGGNDKIATGFLTSNLFTFEGLSIYVPKDDDAVVTVKVNTGDVTSANSASGGTIGLDIDMDADEDMFRAVGKGSQTTIDDSDIDLDGDSTADEDEILAGNDHEVRKTKPTISLASGSPSGQSSVKLIEVLRFNVTADSRGDVTIEEITFEFSATDNASSNWNQCASGALTAADVQLFDEDDTSTDLAEDADVTLLDSTGSSCSSEDVGFIEVDFSGSTTVGEEEVAAGTTKTYILKLDVLDTNSPSAVNDDTMSIDIPDETSIDAAYATDSDAFVWNDSNTSGTDDDNDAGGADSIDAEMLKNLPINGGALLF